MRIPLLLALSAILLFSFTTASAEKGIYIFAETGDYLITHCKTKVTVIAPEYNPADLTYTCEGGKVIPGDSAESFFIYAESGVRIYDKTVIKLNVHYKDELLYTKQFMPISAPLPHIELRTRSRAINTKQGEPAAPFFESFSMQVLPDPSFSAMFPEEDKYSVHNAEILLVRGKRPVATKRVTTDNVDISDWNPQPGDRLLVSIIEITRTSSLGEEKVIFFPMIYNVPLW